MTKLNKIINEGTTVKVNLTFRNSKGKYYIPTKIQYTFLALNNDKESWSVVDNIYYAPISPSSVVTLTIPNVKSIEGKTLQRKVMIYWDAFVDNQYSSFTDEIIFDITPKPYIPNPPKPYPEPEIYVQIMNVNLQMGVLNYAPIKPIFIVETNLPVKIDDANAYFKKNDLIIPCRITKDKSGGVLTITSDDELEYLTEYNLFISGLVSEINDYEMEEPFETTFVTAKENTPHYIPTIEDRKEVHINENGTTEIYPDADYDGIAIVTVDVNVPDNPILLYCYQGTIPFYFSKEITETGIYKAFTTDLIGVEYEVTVDGNITFEYLGNTETVTRDDSSDILR